MTLRIKIPRELNYCIVVLLFIFMYVSAIGRIMYWQTEELEQWRVIYHYSLGAMFALDILFICLHLIRLRKLEPFHGIIFLYLLYETAITFIFLGFTIKSLIVNAYVWPLTFVVFSIYGETHEIPAVFRTILIWGTGICMLLLIKNIQLHITGHGMRGGVIGPLYYCLGFLALIFLFCNTSEKTIFSIITMIMLVISTKRAGVLMIVIGLSGYYLCHAYIQDKLNDRIKKYLRFLFAFLVVALIAYLYFNRYNSTLLIRFSNMFTDQGSGRLIIWELVIHRFQESSIMKKIFGHGFHAVPIEIKPFGREIFAHNSFLEVLYDLGIIGLVGLLFILGRMIHFLIKTIKERDILAPVLVYSMICILLLSTIAGYFFDESVVSVPIAIAWGSLQGMYKRRLSINQA